MNLRAAAFIIATSLRLVILRASGEDARRISTYSHALKFSALQGSKWGGNQ